MSPVAIAHRSPILETLPSPRLPASKPISLVSTPSPNTPAATHRATTSTMVNLNSTESTSPTTNGHGQTPWRAVQRKLSPPRSKFEFDPMEDALAAFKAGEFLMVMDDENRENEGDLIIAASHCTTEKMAWMIKHTSGYICVALPQQRLDELEIPMMVPNNQERHKTAYTVTVDYKHGTTTGISAHDRALTVRSLASPSSSSNDFTRPGHMVPLLSRPGGTLTRKGHTESATDLCMLTDLPLAGVLCELVNDDDEGSMARRDDCRMFADRWGLKMISVEMIVEWRRRMEGEGV